jgi:hypothetical protein
VVFCANPSLRRSRDTLICALKGAQIVAPLLADFSLCGFSFGLGPDKKNKTEVCATASRRRGMGHDGLKGCEALANQNAPVIVQDEAASVGWGMPGFVARAGLGEKILPLNQIGAEISRRATFQPALRPVY